MEQDGKHKSAAGGVVGLTSTAPIEAVFAAGLRPLDLNNIFVASGEAARMVDEAETDGLPRTVCGWTKGVYRAAVESGVKTLLVVVRGDCSEAEALAGLLARRGVRTVPFAYPQDGDRGKLRREIARLAEGFGTDWAGAAAWWRRLRPVRRALEELDRLTWKEGRVSGLENHLWLIGGSDLGGDPEDYAARLEAFIEEARRRPAFPPGPRLGLLGVPSLFTDLHETLERLGARVVLNETARQFGLAFPARGLADQYLRYTYPYPPARRIADVRREAATGRRGIDAFIHHVQSFCYRQVEDALVRRSLDKPVLTIASDRPSPADPATLSRIENFLAALAPLAESGAVRRKAVSDKKERPALEGPPALGLDLGSREVKAVLLPAGFAEAKLVKAKPGDYATWSLEAVEFYRRFAEKGRGGFRVDLAAVLAALGSNLAPEEIAVAATGYGRRGVKVKGVRIVPEIEAHARGAGAAVGLRDFILVDIGGQDTKAARVEGGRVVAFLMNDRCAAGSGRYLENMARVLGASLEELGRRHARPLRLDSTCAIFGETEVVGRLAEGAEEERLLAGVNLTVVRRLLPDIIKMGEGPLVVTGGVALNQAVMRLLRARSGRRVKIPPAPRFAGALGCALLAVDNFRRST